MSDENLKDLSLRLDAMENVFLGLIRAIGKEMRPAIAALAREQLDAEYIRNPGSTTAEKEERFAVHEIGKKLLQLGLRPHNTGL